MSCSQAALPLFVLVSLKETSPDEARVSSLRDVAGLCFVHSACFPQGSHDDRDVSRLVTKLAFCKP